MRQLSIEMDTECELTYRYTNVTATTTIKGTILAFYQPGDEFITFKLRNGKILVISLTHIVAINYGRSAMEETDSRIKC